MTSRRLSSRHPRNRAFRSLRRDQARQRTLRSLRLESLEERRLLASHLELVGVQPDGEDFIADGDIRHQAPTTMRFVFSGNQSIDPATLDGIQLTRAGGDGAFGDANDVFIQPGYIGLSDMPNEVILRFAETLPDDDYRIDISGTGPGALRNTDGDRFQGGEDEQIEFRLDLGAQVIAVVPQPVEDQANALVQHRDKIIVYFNDDDLYVPDAENPALYQLIYTGDTANNGDDVAFNPQSISYDADADMAVLTFADDIHQLINPNTGTAIGDGTFRLRIGTNEAIPQPPDTISPVDDIGSSFDTAFDLGTLDGQSQLVSTAIDSQPFVLDYPGGNDEPGHREIPNEVGGGYDNHLNELFGADSTDGVTTILYNFQANYGVDDQGNPLKNLITDTQKQRARQAFEVWGEYIGVQFLETADRGLTIVTGDPHALEPDADDVVNHALDKPIVNDHFMVRVDPTYQDSLLILDNAHQWNDSFGGDWYKTSMIGIGFMLGLERATDLPESTLMAYATDYSYPGSLPPEPIYPGNQDILHGQYLHRPDSNDIDLYKFVIAPGDEGVFTAETFAERQPNSSLLDSVLLLYREKADGSRAIIARNDDYYSEDSYIDVRLQAGTYYLGVSASGNDQYNPEFENTGLGGKSEGPYDLRVNFRSDPDAGDALRDATPTNDPGTRFDGDADGVPGGVYDFWFRAVQPGQTILVDKLVRPAEPGTKGTFQTIKSALTNAVAGDVIRIVGNAGTDGNWNTLTDNFAYEIGPGPLSNQVLSDGKTLDVPKGVTLMVDAGAIFKMNQSRIGVGSSSLVADRSGGAFQVLGTPGLPVYFTSYDDESIGVDTYGRTTTPRPGNWGGIVFRNDFDNAEERFSYEREGIFLDYVNNADIRYGGGNVIVNSLKQIITPIQMTESRPTISQNRITLSADAPISADPDSFEETNFHAPKFQLKGLFTTDYERVGPDLHDNVLLENSTNGLFLRITTPAGDVQKGLTVAGRFDDTDIVHVLSENLTIEGKSGEPILELERPPVGVVTVAAQPGGQMEPGTYHYKIVYVDANGFEGRPSEATNPVTVSGANRSVKLDKLPAASGDFTARRIYRSVNGVAGPYVFVKQINTSDATYVDRASLSSLDPNNVLQRDVPTVRGVTLTPSTIAGTLEAGTYNYRVVYVNSTDGKVSPSSDPTITRTLSDTGQIELQNLVLPTTNGYDVVRVYRSQTDGDGPYDLVGETTTATFLDTGETLDEVLNPVAFGVARARTDARLGIDPGIIIKLEGSRIETTFGAQLIAEGVDGHEIIFTSRSDDRFGAGGSFDTNGDGGAQMPLPGDWGGLYVGHLGSASIDHALLTFGGGVTKIEGTFKAFNVLEIHQSDVRLAHSTIEYNANGQAGQGPADRFGRGYNEPATIYVRGAQPILVGNLIQNNDEIALTINANSFTSTALPDIGRSTGRIDNVTEYRNNVGPLIRANVMFNNPLNAVDIRGEVLTTQSTWDDTDIVHVLRTIEDTGEVISATSPTRFAGDSDLSDVDDFYNGRYVRFVTGPLAGQVQRVFDYVGSSRTIILLNPFSAAPGVGDRFEIVQSQGEIIVPDFHSNVGLRLQSSPSASLVVKMDGPGDNFDAHLGAGFTATGRQLDIADRIGGTLHIVGQPDFPVILTSLSDDTVGAGFMPNGETLTDTNNNGWQTLPQPGDWRSVRFEQLANDRNVELVLETESPAAAAPGENASTDTAQHLGDLAAFEYGGDENLRLGFEVHGSLGERNDLDVYSFEAAAGTEVWFDIDRSSSSLNSVIELLDANGEVLARSDDSLLESQDPSLIYRSPAIPASSVNPLQKDAPTYQPTTASGLPKDHYSLNLFDAGMRIVLPGVVGVRSTYHLRVRSSSNDIEDVSGGLTNGGYQLQIRLRETDEVPGVTVRYADVRYATNGVELYGLPGHSPLLGEVAEDEEVGGPEHNNQVVLDVEPGTGPQDVGNLFATDRATLSIAGTINSLDDIDFYEMQIGYDATAGTFHQNSPVVFDVDYASGLSRPDTIVTVFDSFGRLLLIGRDSNITDDRGGALDEGDLKDLSRGSLGALDPFIGPVEMPEGTYFVGVSSNARIPSELLGNPDLRLEPVNTVVRVAEDHILESGGSTAGEPQVPLLLDEESIIPQLPENVTVLILHDTGNDDEVLLSAAGLDSGVVTRTVGPYEGKVQDLATRENGSTFTLTTPDVDPAPADDTVGVLRGLNISAPQFIGSRDDGIETYREDPITPGVAVRSNVGIRFHAMTYGDIDGEERLFAVGSRGDAATPPAGPTYFTNVLYQFDPRTGQAISAPQADRVGNDRMNGAGTQVVERGHLDTNAGDGPGGLITGLAIYNNQLYALSETGGLFLVENPLTDSATMLYIDDITQVGVIPDVEANNDLANAQDLDQEVWTRRYSPDIGDTTTNTSTTIKHITIEGTGDDAFSGYFVRGEDGGLDAPIDAVVSPHDGNLYVASRATSEILRYDGTTGEFIDAFVTAGNGGLNAPAQILFGPNGDLYVASTNTDSVLRYDGLSGAFITTFIPSGVGGLDAPTGMLFDGSGNLLISSNATDEVLRFNGVTGNFMNVFVQAGDGGLDSPWGLTYGPDGQLYVASANTNSVIRYNGVNGQFDEVFVPTGSGGLATPTLGLEFGPDGHLYVSSFGTDRVIRYHADSGAVIDSYVSQGADSLDGATGLLFDAAGNLLVCSFNNDRILLYNDDAIEPGWQWQAEPTLSGPIDTDDFAGFAVDLQGDVLVVGAPGDDSIGQDTGTVFVYERDDNGTPTDPTDDLWNLTHQLSASDAAPGDEFGVGVALDGDLLAVGAWQEDETPSAVAAAPAPAADTFAGGNELSDQDGFFVGYTLTFTSGALAGESLPVDTYTGATRTFTFATAFSAAPAAGDEFEITVPDSGAVYAFRYDGTNWIEEAKLTVGDPEVGRVLGRELSAQIDANGDTIVAGAPREIFDAGSIDDANPAAGDFDGDQNLSDQDDFYNGYYVRFESGPLAGEARLVTDYVGNSRNLQFGTAFSADPNNGDTFEILEPEEGEAYIFRFDGTEWFEQEKLVSSDSALLDMFGRGVTVDAGTVLVGAPNANDYGTVYRFERDDNGTATPTDDTWTEVLAYVARDGSMNDKFGWSVGLEGDRAVVGALRDDDGAANGGSAYVLLWELNNWTQVTKLTAPDALANDRFGETVDVEGDRVLVGAPDGDVGVTNSGAVYLFEVDDLGTADPFDDIWTMEAEVATSHAATDNDFGSSAAISGDWFVGGDPNHDFLGDDAGSAQVYVLADLAQATFETFFVPFGTGGMADPRQIILGPDNLVYVAAATSNRILRFDGTTGELVDVFVPSGSGGLETPEGIAFGPDSTSDGIPELFVTSRGTDQVLRYDGDTGAFIDVFADLGFQEPTGIVFGPDTSGDTIPELYVSGFTSDNVVEFDGDTGTFRRQMVPPTYGGLDGPMGLEFRPDGNLYVASANSNSVLRYDANTGLFVDDFIQSGLGGLSQPQYFLFGPDANADGEDELYVTSFANDSVLRYSAVTGAFVDDFVYSGNEGLDGPSGITFTVDGYVIVASSLTDEIMKFDTAGTPTFDYFHFTVANDGDRGFFDIDYGTVDGDPGSFDTQLFVLDAGGNILAQNDDSNIRFGQQGSTSTLDSYIEVVFATAGEYYLVVGEFNSTVNGGVATGNRPDLTDTYVLHASIENFEGASLEGMAMNMLPTDDSEDVFIAIDRRGDLFAFTTDDTTVSDEPIFAGGRNRIPTGVQDVMGIALTTTNLFHVTDWRSDDTGHGPTNVFDDSRGNASDVVEREPNDTPATAHDLELEFWHLGYNSNIGDASDPPINTSERIPHVTVRGSGDGTRDYYSFEVTEPNSLGIFDIDMDFDEQLDPHWFMDAEIRLLDEHGNLITWVEDAVLPTDGDGGKDVLYDPPLEPYLEWVFTTPGVYVLEVTKFVNPFIWLPPEDGDFYTLQVSLENHPVDGPKLEAGKSFFFGTELTGVITNAVPNGTEIEFTSPGHGLLGGERVDIQGVLGIPLANGTYVVTDADDAAGTFTIDLVDLDATGTYLGGGEWRFIYTPEDMGGELLTKPFSLLGYSPEDLPVLYFNYLLDSGSSVVGVSIVEGTNDPVPLLVSGTGLQSALPGGGIPLQPQWRQARVELDDYAGKEDLRLLFEYESSAVSGSFEGFMLDDIIIGFAERGEMVSYAYNNPSFTTNLDSETTDALTGPYQLEIRPGTDPGRSQRPTAETPNSQVLERVFDTNERHARQTSLVPSAGADITDAQTFTVSDGSGSLTFEFDNDGVVAEGNVRVPFETTFNAVEVAASIRDAVNSPSVQSAMDITATTSAATLQGTNFADGSTPTEPLYQLVDLAGTAIVTDIQHVMYDGIGDVNRFRDQGQVLIHSNFITDSRDFGIVADAGVRDTEERMATALLQSHWGPVRNLRELNNDPVGGLAPGALIENNVISNEGLGGIHASGNLAPWEIVAPTDTLTTLSGEFVCDGTTITVHTYRTDVTFEFEDISGGSAPCGSTIQGGNGWTDGNIPIYYRQAGGNYLAPPWVIPPRPYVQEEMATAIRDAIQSSILVTNGTTLHANASLEATRWERHALTGLPLVSVYLDNVSDVTASSTIIGVRQTPLGAAAQPFHRVLNNTIYGNDGTQAFFPGSGFDEPNDTMDTAVETQQGRQHNPQVFASNGTIGDGSETYDQSHDVDLFQFQLEIGERVVAEMGSEQSALVNEPGRDGPTSGFTQSETSMVKFGNNVVVGYNDSGSAAAGNKFTGWSVSRDGGQSFMDMGELPTNPNGDSGDPVLARDEVDGTIYFATLTGTSGPIHVFRSFDDGQTFTTPVVATPGKTAFQDKPWMTVDNAPGGGQGNVYVTATDFAATTGIYFFRSTDGGASYGPSGGTLIATGAVQGSWVVVGEDHTVYVFYHDANSAQQTIKMRRSTDFGATFSPEVVVQTLNTTGVGGNLGLTVDDNSLQQIRSNAFPQAVVNPVSDDLYVIYNDDPTGLDKGDIFFTMSSDRGTTWSAPVRVNSDSTINDQWQPTIAVTPDGENVGIFWYDRRNSANNGMIEYWGQIGDVVGSSISFTNADFRVSDNPFPPIVAADPLVNATYMGDYDQALADDDNFFTLWADNSLGTPDVRFATIPLAGRNQEVEPVLRLFDARGEEVAIAQGEGAAVDFTASEAGTYYVGVSGVGNDAYDPLSLGNRTGPASVGDYHLEVDVIAPRTWVIQAQDGTQVVDGTTFTVSDINRTVTYEFDDVNNPGVTPPNIPIVYDSSVIQPQGVNHRGPGYRAPEMAVAMAEVIGQGLEGVSAIALGGVQGASGPLPLQTPAITGDTSFWGIPGFGHNSPYTTPDASGELYVVISGASRVTGAVLFQPSFDENIDQLMPETGILVSEAASPTLLNNVLSNLNAGIWQDASPTTVVGGSTYQHNDQEDSNVGSTNDDFNVHLGGYEPLFVNAPAGNFYPAPYSPIIDSATDALEERSGFASIKDSVGIPVSPILAPDLDAVGLLRSDDPEVDTPSGQGANVFKDRGGLDRADFVGPDAVLIVPRDNDDAGIDLDPTDTVVQLSEGTYNNFSIQLVDGLQSSAGGEGVGVNDLTVNSGRITLTADGELLEEGVDYTFRYNAITNTIRFTPLAGMWENNKAYVITLPNRDRFVVEIPDGSQVSDGELFVITDENGGTVNFEFESGYSLFVPETLTLYLPEEGKGPGGIEDGQRFTVSAGVFGQTTFEYDNNIPPSYLPGNVPIDISAISTQEELALATVAALDAALVAVDPVYLGDGMIHFGATANYSIDTSLSAITQTGQPGLIVDGDSIQISDGVNPTKTFEFDRDGNVATGNIPIPFALASTQDDIATSIANTITAANVGLLPTYFGDGHVHLGGTTDHQVETAGTPNLTQTGQPGVRTSTILSVPPQAAGVGGIADGQWFSIQNRPDDPVIFEFDSDGSVSAGARPILFTPTSTVQQLSGYIISAINVANVGLTPEYLGTGLIALHDTIHHKTATLNTALDQQGVPGGVVTIEFLPDASFDADQFAPLILDAIADSQLTDVTSIFRGGNTYFIDGVRSISGLQNFFIASIEDKAGNRLQPNQSTNETYFTILMPGVQFDLGDAPDSYGTLFNADGARHVISDNPLLLGLGVTTETDGKPSPGADADEDDGVDLTMSVFNSHVVTPVTVTATGRGVLDAWIDFNMDGDWEDLGEQVVVSQQLSAGANEVLISTPSFAQIGDTFARFRISRLGGLSPTGLATDGEVEDYVVRIEPGMPPVANDDSGFLADANAPLTILQAQLLLNDTDPDTPHNQLAVWRFETMSELGATLYWDGSDNIVYDPTTSARLEALQPGDILVDSFAYQATDGVLPSNWATVTVTVTGVNNPPVAVPDDYATIADQLLRDFAPGVLGNDYDPDFGDTITVISHDATSAMGASVVVNPNGGLFYDPRAAADVMALAQGETGTDTFTYTIADNLGDTDTATVSIQLTGVNDAPTAVDDSYGTDEDTPLDIAAPGVLDNDFDIDGDNVSVSGADTFSQFGAEVRVNADGSFSYDPTGSNILQDLAVGESLDDTFQYTIMDDFGITSSATVTVTVDGQNDAPVAMDDDYASFEDESLTVQPFGVLGNDTDRDGDVLSVDVLNSDATSALGVPVAFAADGGFTYDLASHDLGLAPGAVVTDTFTYTVTDPYGGTDTATVSITVTGVNSAPVATDKSFATDEDTPLNISAPGVLAGDSDPDGQAISIDSYDATSLFGADVVVNPDGSFSYDPLSSQLLQAMNVGTTITDSFTYTIVDDDIDPRTDTATIFIEVDGLNDAPVAEDDYALVLRNGSRDIEVLANDSDVDGTVDASSVNVTAAPSHGTFTVLANGRIRYTPATDFSGDDELRYTVRDNSSAVSNEAVVTLRVNAPPVAVDDPVTTFLNVPTTIDVLANDSDIDGVIEPDTLTIIDQPTNGSVSINASHKVIYTPDTGYTGPDLFTYVVSDNDGVPSNVAEVSVAVIIDPLPWQNPINPMDVNASGAVSPLDVLEIIRFLNKNGAGPLPNPPIPPLTPPPFLDPTGDNAVSPLDALSVIRFLNGQGAGEGEGDAEGESDGAGAGVMAAQSSSSPVARDLPPLTTGQDAGQDQGGDESILLVPESNGADDVGPQIGVAADVHGSALAEYLASSARDEDLEELLEWQDEGVLEDQALLELLSGKEN